jgi:putative transposase
MRKSRYSEEQIIGVLKEAEAGMSVAELARKHGITEQTFYRWKSKFGGLEVSEARRLRVLEQENGKLKKLVAELLLDNQVLKELNAKNG